MKQLARNESFVDLLVEKEKNAHAYFELCVIQNGVNNFLFRILEPRTIKVEKVSLM